MDYGEIAKKIPGDWAEIHKQRINELALEKTEEILLNEYKIHVSSGNHGSAGGKKILKDPARKIVGIQMMLHQISVAIDVPREDLDEAISSVSYLLAAYEFFSVEYQNLLGDIPTDENGHKIFPEPINEVISKGINASNLMVIQDLIGLLESGLSLL